METPRFTLRIFDISDNRWIYLYMYAPSHSEFLKRSLLHSYASHFGTDDCSSPVISFLGTGRISLAEYRRCDFPSTAERRRHVTANVTKATKARNGDGVPALRRWHIRGDEFASFRETRMTMTMTRRRADENSYECEYRIVGERNERKAS